MSNQVVVSNQVNVTVNARRSLFVHWILPILALGAIAIAAQYGC